VFGGESEEEGRAREWRGSEVSTTKGKGEAGIEEDFLGIQREEGLERAWL